MILTREDLLGRKRVKKATLADGVGIYMKELPASFFISPDKKKERKEEETDGVAQIIASVCDERGEPLFEAADREAILSLPLADFSALTRAIAEVNGLRVNDEEDGRTEAEKN